ncbi:hypothetical protein HDU76_002049 [Blyttiomyces sp. JEL0837]|nr:hypothetical protein HDU76_002049 [Blyttiomyces sp. JEL0837]
MRDITVRRDLELFSNEESPSRKPSLTKKEQQNGITASNSSNNEGDANPNANNQLPRLTHAPLHIHASRSPPEIANVLGVNALNFSEPVHSTIQNIWSTFNGMGDAERNQLLRGLLAKCSTKQVDLICTSLNLKMTESTIAGCGPTIFANEIPGKYSQQQYRPPKKPVPAKPIAAVSAEHHTSPTKKTPSPPHHHLNNVKETAPPKLPNIDKDTRSKEVGFVQESYDTFTNKNIDPEAKETRLLGLDFGPPAQPPSSFDDVPTNELFRSHFPTPASHPLSHHEPHSSFMNANLYIKLLNSAYDTQAIVKQIQKAGLESTRAVVTFLSERCKKLQNILLCMHDVATESETEKALIVLLKAALQAVDGKNACLYTVDPLKGDLVVRSSTWMTEGAVVPIENIFCGSTVLRNETVNMYNLKTADVYTDALHEVYGRLEADCILSLPIVTENAKVTGIIEIAGKATASSAPYFTAEDEFMLRGLSSMWTLLLNHSQVEQTAMRKSDDIRIVLNTASLMSSELDLADLTKIIMQTAQELLNAERCALFMVDKEKQELWSTVAQGAGQIRIPMNKGIAGHVATTGEVLNIPNAYNDRRFNRSIDLKTGFKTRNILCMPMRNHQGEVIGVTQVINKLPESFTFSKEDELLLMAFSSLAAVTIEKSILFQALQMTLKETNQTKNFMSMILQSITNVVMTLDGTGRLVTINHPAKLGFEELIPTMKLTTYEYWLGRDNPTLIADIQRVYRGEGPINAHDYELVLDGKKRSVNYTIVQMNHVISTDPTPFSLKKSLKPSSDDSIDGSSSGNNSNGSDQGDVKGAKNNKALVKTISDASSSSGRGGSGGAKRSDNESEADESNGSSHSLNGEDTTGVGGVVIVIEDISKEKRVMNTLGRYMNPALVHRVMTDGGSALGGTRQKISVIFADIRNFTNLSETMDPVDVVTLLNEHYTHIVDSILAETGILDKYIGDAAMGVFGVPFSTSEDSKHAVNAAIRMKKGLEELNKRNTVMRRPTLRMGIGIATGMVLSGNIGSAKRMEYTVIGEAVNIASRIESCTKVYGTMLLVDDRTHDEVKDGFHMREIDKVIVKGKTVPVTIYEVLGPIDKEVSQDTMTALICFELGLSEYRNQNWSVAMSHFRKAIQVVDDPPSKTFLERCKGILDGIYEIPALGVWDTCWRFYQK